jgi:chromosome segregation ATPase
VNQQAGELEAKLKSMDLVARKYKEELETCRNQTTAVQRSLDSEKEKNMSLDKKSAKMQQNLKHYSQFSVKMEKLDLPETYVGQNICSEAYY